MISIAIVLLLQILQFDKKIMFISITVEYGSSDILLYSIESSLVVIFCKKSDVCFEVVNPILGSLSKKTLYGNHYATIGTFSLWNWTHFKSIDHLLLNCYRVLTYLTYFQYLGYFYKLKIIMILLFYQPVRFGLDHVFNYCVNFTYRI